VLDVLGEHRSMAWNDLSVGLAAGTGFGLMHSVIMHVGVILSGGGTGTLFPGQGECPASLWVLASFQGLFEWVAHTALMVVALDAARRPSPVRGAVARWGGIVALHALWALPSLANTSASGCVWALVVQALVAAGCTVWAVAVVRSSDYLPTQRAARIRTVP
jgi:hypothetical protein